MLKYVDLADLYTAFYLQKDTIPHIFFIVTSYIFLGSILADISFSLPVVVHLLSKISSHMFRMDIFLSITNFLNINC